MNTQKIDDEETLYRVVKNSDPNSLINGKLCPAFFLDDTGLSVDRDGGRDEQTVINKLKSRFNCKSQDYKAAAKITAKQCRDVDACPLPKPSKSNQYHAEIWNSLSTVKLTIDKAMKLAHFAILIE